MCVYGVTRNVWWRIRRNIIINDDAKTAAVARRVRRPSGRQEKTGPAGTTPTSRRRRRSNYYYYRVGRPTRRCVQEHQSSVRDGLMERGPTRNRRRRCVKNPTNLATFITRALRCGPAGRVPHPHAIPEQQTRSTWSPAQGGGLLG